MDHEIILITLVALAGLYMAWNIGANDVANAMGTSVGSGSLTLRQAVFIAAVLEFTGALLFGSHVSDTIQQGIVNPSIFAFEPMNFVKGMLASLIAAGIWLQIASYYGWPVSTTHSIIGAIVGFGAIVGGLDAIYWKNVFFIATSWILSPILGGIVGYLVFIWLRKVVFYASSPIAATKKIVPWLVLIFLGTISLIIMFGGLKNLNIHLNLVESIFFSLLLGSIGAFIAFFLVKDLPNKKIGASLKPDTSQEAIQDLEKAKKYLFAAREKTKGSTSYQVGIALDELEHLSHSMEQDDQATPSEYELVEKVFGYLQIMSASFMAFAHGANDVANAIGPVAAAFVVLKTGKIPTSSMAIPIWILALGGLGIVAGLATWGWRVIETIGKKLTELTPSRGFAAEFGAALTIVFASRLGLPISTTHTLVGAVLGIGLARGIEALDLSTTRDIVVSWIVTVPAGALISIAVYYLLLFIPT
ncbi:inorganic phosphate transporter [Criblamydia sequanensis]|uniref:Phosphate transporter n=1 Tax=Candidatus Criblamydia sequanensis CRIB-18 TaxID=1437425 RepID=A0A090CZP3_9BACT|nr:inorganic phosphate transporter [Criblamydia sequanensis]CDR34622.1 Putative inorganic phosphate transporter [Criblamydia sequanensis CRIB-18]